MKQRYSPSAAQQLGLAPEIWPYASVEIVHENDPYTQRLAVYDAINACLRYLSESRTRGRFELFLAVEELNAVLR